jgi:hypothetical protein
LTEIFVVVCTAAGRQCIKYVDVTPAVLSTAACDLAIQDVARHQIALGAVLNREISSCTLMIVNTQNDLTFWSPAQYSVYRIIVSRQTWTKPSATQGDRPANHNWGSTSSR